MGQERRRVEGPGRSTSAFERLRHSPTALALLLAIPSLPVIAFVLMQRPTQGALDVGWTPLGIGEALILASVSIGSSAIVGGWLGGRLIGRRPTLAVTVTLASAWITAVSALSITAALFGIRYQAAVLCIDACSAGITSDPLSGLIAVLTGAVVGAIFLVAAVPLWIVGVALNRHRHGLLASVAVALAIGAVEFWALVLDGAVPYLCLAVGVIAWSWVLRTRMATGVAARDGLEAAAPR